MNCCCIKPVGNSRVHLVFPYGKTFLYNKCLCLCCLRVTFRMIKLYFSQLNLCVQAYLPFSGGCTISIPAAALYLSAAVGCRTCFAHSTWGPSTCKKVIFILYIETMLRVSLHDCFWLVVFSEIGFSCFV